MGYLSLRRRPGIALRRPPFRILRPHTLTSRGSLIDADLLRVPVGPGAMHVERYGHGGQPVVLLHGFGTSSFLWRTVGPMLARAGHTAFAIDLFGYGESDRPFDAGFGIADQAEYLDRAFTALRLSSALVVGVDLGGTVALRLAVTRPERVRALVLVNTPAFDAVPGDDVRTLQRNTARFAFRASRGVLGAAPLLTSVLEGSVASLAHMPDRLVARYLAPFVGTDGVSHLLALARAIDAEDIEPLELETIGAPTLVLWGDADEWIDADVSHQLAATLPVSRRIELPGIARLAPEEAPERLAQLILAMVSDANATVRGELPVEPVEPVAPVASEDSAAVANAGTLQAQDPVSATELRDVDAV